MKKYTRLRSHAWEKGFTLVEFAVALCIIGVLLGMITINLLKVQRSSSVNATVQTMEADIKQQQIKAMVGATEGRSTYDNYGVYVESNRYTWFHGNVYTSNDPTNFVVTFDTNIQASTTFPSGLIVFSHDSGEIIGWTAGQNTITIRNTAGSEIKTMTLNRYGVITSIQ